jgi:muramoyltetrapeptide carboxypeptidase
MPLLHLIAPSGDPQDQDAVARAVDYFQEKGWQVKGQSSALRHFQRFAGTDDERAAELNALAKYAQPEFKDSKPDFVMALRGGYGLSRILDRIDFEGLAAADLVFIGHSDFTAFTLAYYAITGKASYSGPMTCFDFGADSPSSFTQHHFWELLGAGIDATKVRVAQPYQFKTEGVLWGGNLTMVSQLVGSRYLPEVKDGILFLEDINEHPYRIERAIYQLREAGILSQQRAIILGQFNGYKLYENDAGYDFDEMVKHLRSRIDIPLLTDLPFGHVRDKLTLPVGRVAQLDVSQDDGYVLSYGRI